MTQGLIETLEGLEVFVDKIINQKGDNIGKFILENYIYFSINAILESSFGFKSYKGIRVNGYNLLVDNYDTHIVNHFGKVNITGTLVGCIQRGGLERLPLCLLHEDHGFLFRHAGGSIEPRCGCLLRRQKVD